MTVVSRSESGMRGYQATLARHGKARMDSWRKRGGRKPNLSYIEILEIEREKKASARLKSRSSSRSGGNANRSDFDRIS